MKEEWSDFDENVDDTLPLAGVIKEVSLDFSHLDPSNNISISFPGVSNEELRLQQEQDYNFGVLMEWLKDEGGISAPSEGDLTLSSPELRHYWSVRTQFVFLDGVLYFRWEDLTNSRLLLCIPESLKDKVLFYCHDCMWEGHPGKKRPNMKCVNDFIGGGQVLIAKFT